MNESPVPEPVRDFLLEHIDSVAQLEALLLLRQSAPRSWDPTQLARRLYIEESEARTVLSGLVAGNLVVTDGTAFQFFPESDEQKALIDALTESYAHYLVPVTTIIHEKAAGIRKFANAFKFRKDK
jgi:hypothetical protein